MPLTQIHKNAMNAAKAVVAAGNQGKTWEMHDELFKISNNLSLDEIKKVAERLGLDAKKFETDMNFPEAGGFVQDGLAVARTISVNSTPTFFINGKIVTMRTFEGMKAMVDEEVAKTKRTN